MTFAQLRHKHAITDNAGVLFAEPIGRPADCLVSTMRPEETRAFQLNTRAIRIFRSSGILTGVESVASMIGGDKWNVGGTPAEEFDWLRSRPSPLYRKDGAGNFVQLPPIHRTATLAAVVRSALAIAIRRNVQIAFTSSSVVVGANLWLQTQQGIAIPPTFTRKLVRLGDRATLHQEAPIAAQSLTFNATPTSNAS